MAKELSLGMSVSCSDGEVGRLERIVVDPDTREPAYLVVRRGRVSQRDTVMPVSLVTEITSEGIVLGIGSEAFKTFPDYEITVEKYLPEEYDYVSRWPEIPPLWKAGVQNDGMVKVRERTVSEHTADISRGMKVFDDAGVAVGEIEGVIADPDTRQASHLVLARGFAWCRWIWSTSHSARTSTCGSRSAICKDCLSIKRRRLPIHPYPAACDDTTGLAKSLAAVGCVTR